MSVGVTVVMGDGHVVQPVVLRGDRPRVGQSVGLVGEPIGRAEALGGAYGAGPLAWVHIGMQGAISLEAVLFGSGWRRGRKRCTLESASFVRQFHLITLN